MALTKTILATVCKLGISAAALCAGVVDVTVAQGVVEFLGFGTDLAFAGDKKQIDKLNSLATSMQGKVEKQMQSRLKHQFGADFETRLDVTNALKEFSEYLPRIKLSPDDLVNQNFDEAALIEFYREKLPSQCSLKKSDLGQKIFKTIIGGTFDLVRSDPDFSARIQQLSFKKIFAGVDEINTKISVNHEELLAGQEKLLAVMSAEKGVDPKHLKPLFKAVGRETDTITKFKPAIRAAVKKLQQIAKDPVQPMNDGVAVEAAINAARAKLRELDTEGAIDILDQAMAQDETFEAAALGRVRILKEKAEISAAAYGWDVAIAALEKAGNLLDDDAWIWFECGDIYVHQGKLYKALDCYQKGGEIAKASGDIRDLSASHIKIGDVRVSQGDQAGALKSYEAGLVIRETLAAGDPSNAERQRDLSVSHDRIGNVRVSQGDQAGALKSYEAGHEIAEKLAAGDPSNAEWQRDLSVSHDRIGDVRVSQGDQAGALKSYEAGHGIAEKLAADDPSNAGWQRDLSVSHNKIGDVRVSQDDQAGALKSYEADLVIAETLAAGDPSNAGWQHDLSVSHDRIGDVRVSQGDQAGALKSYEASLVIRETLAAGDPSNAGWRCDLIVSYWKLADIGNDEVGYNRKALAVATQLKTEGKMAPVDEWMVDELKRRLDAAKNGE